MITAVTDLIKKYPRHDIFSYDKEDVLNEVLNVFICCPSCKGVDVSWLKRYEVGFCYDCNMHFAILLCKVSTGTNTIKEKRNK